MKNIFTKMKQFFGLDELEIHDTDEVVQKEKVVQQPQRETMQQAHNERAPEPQKNQTFRFPLIDDMLSPRSDSTVEKVSTAKKSAVYQDPREDETLRLPKHIAASSQTLDVEVSGIRELLEKRGRKTANNSQSVVRLQRGERPAHKVRNVTRDEAVFLTDRPIVKDVVRQKENPEFINPFEQKKRFTPTHVPSPVYGFQQPKPIRELLKDERNIDLTIPVVIEAEEVIPTDIHKLNAQEEDNSNIIIKDHSVEQLSETGETFELEQTKEMGIEEKNEQTIYVEEIAATEQAPIIITENDTQSEAIEEVLEEESVNEQIITPNNVHRINDLQLKNVTFQNSTVHIGQIHVEPVPVEQAETSETELEVQQEIISEEINVTKAAQKQGSKLPFNVLMLKSDKEKIQNKPLEAIKGGVPKTIIDKVELRRDAQKGLMQAGMPLPKELQDDYDGDLATKQGDQKVNNEISQTLEVVKQEPSIAVRENHPVKSNEGPELPQQNILVVQQEVAEASNEKSATNKQLEQYDEMEHLLLNKFQTAKYQNSDFRTEEVHETTVDEIIESPTDFDSREEQEIEQEAIKPSVELDMPTVNVESLLKDVQAVEEIFQPSEVLEEELPGVESVLLKQNNESKVEIDQSNVVIQEELIDETVHYEKPSLDFLVPPEEKTEDFEWMDEQAKYLIEALQSHQIQAQVESIVQGPAVTQFEITVAAGTKVSKVRNLSDDIKLALAAKDIRIDAPIPGKRTIGIEIPNRIARAVRLSEVTDSEVFQQSDSPLEAALGLNLNGKPVTIDLRKMPHGLIAGATGSGKSVCINSILVSLLYKADPHELKLMLIDPKMVELAPFNHIPHLVSPVITDVKAATAALKWAVEEMERRYALFMHAGVRDITRYNSQAEIAGQHAQKMPYLLIVIDELADLMMIAPADVEEAICRIAQKARACGIHLIVATQRPSVDVITGLIKSNIPTRIAFAVSSAADSRTILDSQGAERLLGRGDMLYLGNGMSAPVRLQGTFVTDDEIEEIIDYVRSQGEPKYLFQHDELLKKAEFVEEQDELFEEVCRFVFEQGSASTSSIQRRYHLGYNRAARLVDMLERNGFVSEQRGSKPREVFITQDDLDSLFS